MQWLGRPYTPAALRVWQQERKVTESVLVFGHAGYLINLAAPASKNRDLSIQSLVLEVELAEALRLPFLVLHPGAHLGSGENCGVRQAAAGLNEVIRATPRARVRLALENTAGQGTCLGDRLEHLAEFYQLVDVPKRLGICIDTAHLFAAGYDIRSREGWDEVVATLRKLVGIRQILAVHLNDSKTVLGSRVDRHEHIGKGHIGLKAFAHIVRDTRFKRLPGCIETPKSKDLHEDIANLSRLRFLRDS